MSEIKRMGRNASEDWKDRLDLFSEIMAACRERVISMTKVDMIDHYIPGRDTSAPAYEGDLVLALFNAVISPYRAEGSLDEKIQAEEEIFKANVGTMQNLFNTIRESQQTRDAAKEGFLPLPAPVAPVVGLLAGESEPPTVPMSLCEHTALKIYFGFMECPDDVSEVDLSSITVGEAHVRCPACHVVVAHEWARSGNLWHDALKAAKGGKDVCHREVHDLESQDRREKTCE